MAPSDKKHPTINLNARRASTDSDESETGERTPLKSSRAARFEDAEPTMTHYQAQPQPSDIGFGYINQSRESAVSGVELPATPRSPLKSALKSPGAAPRKIEQNPLSPTFKENPLSPTWRQEAWLEKREKKTTKQQAKDLKVKVRVRVAKIFLRFTNFSCSLIVLAMLSSTFSIFNATKAIPPRNNLPPWAVGTSAWPQITLLVISCVSLFMSMVILFSYWRSNGQKRAEKAALYYTTFSVAFFIFSIIMWAFGAGILQGAKNNSGGKDLWGWSCKDNARKQLFEQEVSYNLICRLQNWSLVCCIIEVVVETITILIYGIVFYRFYSKRQLRKSMAKRDTARSDLYLSQLKSQTAPNTPGLPMSPRDGGYNPMFSPRYAGAMDNKQPGADEYSVAEEGAAEGVRYVTAPSPMQAPSPKPFTLQAPPSRGTPKMQQQKTFGAATPEQTSSRPQTANAASTPVMSPVQHSTPVHVPAAPGEQQYAAVPIPGAYASPIASPTFGQAQQSYFAPPPPR